MGCQDTHVEFLGARTCCISEICKLIMKTIKCMIPTHSVKLDVPWTYVEKFFDARHVTVVLYKL